MIRATLTAFVLTLTLASTTAFAHGSDSAIELAESWDVHSHNFDAVVKCIDAAETSEQVKACQAATDL